MDIKIGTIRSIYLLIIFFGIFGIAEKTSAAYHYIRQGASGTNNGSDWTNAWTTLPANLTRGDTYYIAEGDYDPYTFDDVVAGEQYITIKKAIQSDHGTDSGWSDSFGDRQAVFSGTGTLWNVDSSYWIFDGQIGSGEGGYGFKLDFFGTNDSARALDVDGSNITVRYVDVEGNGFSGIDSGYNQDGIYTVGGTYSNIILSHNYIHDWKRCGIIFASGVSDVIIEHNLIARTYSSSEAHGQGIQIGASGDSNYNFIIRYNDFYNVQGSGFIFYLGGSGSVHHDIDVYGNLFWSDDPLNWNTATAIGTNKDTTCNRCNAYNNTFYGLTGRGSSGVLELDHGYGEARNNLIYGSNSGFTGNWTASHNASDDDFSNQPSFQFLAVNPFTNSTAGNFNLSSPLNASYDMSGLYVVDISGNIFGADGVWDRGAYEYVSGITDTTPPAVPLELKVE